MLVGCGSVSMTGVDMIEGAPFTTVSETKLADTTVIASLRQGCTQVK